MEVSKKNGSNTSRVEELIVEGVPLEIVILNNTCPAGDTYVDEKGVLRRRLGYDDGPRYWEHSRGRPIRT